MKFRIHFTFTLWVFLILASFVCGLHFKLANPPLPVGRAASRLDCEKLFTAEDSTGVAIELLAGVAAGRGSNLSHRTAFRDRRHAAVTLLRPLREISAKELALYAQFHGLPHRAVPTLSTGTVLHVHFALLRLGFVFLFVSGCGWLSSVHLSVPDPFTLPQSPTKLFHK
jgi:hypothetical protein